MILCTVERIFKEEWPWWCHQIWNFLVQKQRNYKLGQSSTIDIVEYTTNCKFCIPAVVLNAFTNALIRNAHCIRVIVLWCDLLAFATAGGSACCLHWKHKTGVDFVLCFTSSCEKIDMWIRFKSGPIPSRLTWLILKILPNQIIYLLWISFRMWFGTTFFSFYFYYVFLSLFERNLKMIRKT